MLKNLHDASFCPKELAAGDAQEYITDWLAMSQAYARGEFTDITDIPL